MQRREMAVAWGLGPGRRPFFWLGCALLAQMAVPLAVQYAVRLAAELLAPEAVWSVWASSLLLIGSNYGVGFLAFCLMIRRTPAAPPERGRPLGPVRFLQVYGIALGLMYLVNYGTILLMGLLGAVLGGTVTNPVDQTADNPMAVNLLLGCVIAPLVEETMFRGLLLNRLRPYGEKFAVAASALCFGLFHGNLSQFFYAFVIGMVLAYVALRTGRLWQTILLHAMLNVISMGLLPLLEPLGAAGERIVTILVPGVILAGLALLIALWGQIRFAPDGSGLPAGCKWRLLLGNPGMVCVCLLFVLQAGACLM